MISRYILFDITSGLPTVITTSIEAYEEYMVYGSVIAVGVDEVDLTEDIKIMNTWHWMGDAIGTHSEQPGTYWAWDITTWSYIFIAPAPVINVGAYSTLSEYRKITIYGNAVDTYWTTPFPIQLRTNTVADFATATVLTEDIGNVYVKDNTEVTSRYYYLTPYYLDDFYVPVYGATVSTGSVIPLAVETGDIGSGAVNGAKLASGTVNTQLSGTGVNVLNSRYTTFEELALPYFSTHPNGTISQDATAKYFGTKSLKAVTTGAGGYWSSSVTTNNITPNKKWILSFYVYSATSIAAPIWGSAGVHAGIETLSSYYGTGYYDGTATSTTLTIPAGIWTRVYGVLDLTADSNTTCNLRLDSHATGTTVWFDGIMLEAQVGGLKTPSVYHEPPNFLTTYTGVLDATKNTMYRQNAAPTGGTYTVGDLWFDTDAVPALMYNWSGSAWVVVANNVTNTNQVTDGAGLGTTALWTGVTGTGKADDNATVGANLLSTYTIPVGTTPASLILTTGTSAATYTAGSGTLTKTGTLLGWNASGYSTNGFTGGAQVSFTTVAPSTGSYMVGLNSDPATNAVYSTLDYAIHIAGLTQLIYESNVQITRPGATNTYVAGDSFSVIYNGANLVNYYRNGILFYSTYVNTPITAALYMDSSFYETGMSCTALKFNVYSAPVLLSGNNLVGVIHAGNAGDHLSDNIISTKTVLPNSISDFQSSSTNSDASNYEYAQLGGSISTSVILGNLTAQGDPYSKVLALMSLSNILLGAPTNNAQISISVQKQSLNQLFYTQGIGTGLGADIGQAYEPPLTTDVAWYVTAPYTITFNAATGVDIATDTFTTAASNYYTGSKVRYMNTNGSSMVNLSSYTKYYIIKLTSTTFKLAYTLEDALDKVPIPINITAVGTGTPQFESAYDTYTRYYSQPTKSVTVTPSAAGVNITTNVFTIYAMYPNGVLGGDRIFTGMDLIYTNSSAGVDIAPLVSGTMYYVIKLTNTTFKLATTKANAIAETPVAINITTVGSGAVGSHEFIGLNKWMYAGGNSGFNIGNHSITPSTNYLSTTVTDSGSMGVNSIDTFIYTLDLSFAGRSPPQMGFDAVLSALVSKR